MASGSVDEAMRRAIALAARGLGTASPNPVVGCVLLDPDGEVVGEGFHAYAGGPHAEIVALAQAGLRARGGTAVVTLEPCDHTGRTGPCSHALIAAGVARVVVAVPDPDPVAAGGAVTLRAAGLQVEFGVRAAEAEAGNVAWLTSVRRGRPYVIWKFAATLDGRSAAADGTSMWITSEAARADVHALRGTVDAVIAGVGTVLADDPRLTVRNPRDGTPAIRQPLRVVVDSLGRTPAGAQVRDGAAPTWIATAAQVGAGPDGRVDLPALLAELHRRGVRAALLEGGPSLAGAFLAAGLVDRVVGYVAPRLLGAGPTALADAGVTTIADAIDLELTDVTQVGPDLRITALPRKREG
ncbi:bifunctional diaminohydroxyphosphoribosylaminopyrimidine deaminase/5-amino-6-(5-phosphoribosylamino)uracil reductase RibD [Micromonospora sp. NBC_01655]|uniref:bifunctional diaminohydroxyphosphoribosylaminopyrimidine deaminase/5-amino-6-(5-phosphoribosylamino)uracil reductase RibD n=1 Tax=Micromonospora sp. NBC_01655 TaxID=2975983 RepID=UPI00224D9546|nr:bifunctional diaminohydroxyphosphoribosylaminopyrimidine deaminase/5-amino-6-(5-phosphoribosylamino)uracil reductase RibD [Micromonospora sp. NBC_01655]MCX4473152.1 bifunctional diaminohydroxyphosphoribosylaminopyrimidine deaminase/5-amino-6-(5-phosphoribosylamino)uracil reductase RibD [Micromonospora sp. NBC_01655]